MSTPPNDNPDATVDDRFSDQLESWLEQDDPKTIGSLTDLIDEKSFAVVALLLACFSLSADAGKVPAGFTDHDAEVNGVRIRYAIGGKGSAVVLRRFSA